MEHDDLAAHQVVAKVPQAGVQVNVAHMEPRQPTAQVVDVVLVAQHNVQAVAHFLLAPDADHLLAQVAVDVVDAKCKLLTFQNTSTLTR